MMFDIDL